MHISPKFFLPSTSIFVLLMSSIYFCCVRYHYDKNFNPDREVLIGLYETFEKMVLDVSTRVTIDQRLEKFKGAKGLFGMYMAIASRNKKQPGNEITLITTFI